MSEARVSLSDLLKALNKSQWFCRTKIYHAPAAEDGWTTLADLIELTETHALRMVNRIDDDEQDEPKAEIPALTPDLSANLAGRINARRESIARDEIIRKYQASRTRRPSPTPRFH